MRKALVPTAMVMMLISTAVGTAQGESDVARPQTSAGSVEVIDVPAPSLAGSLIPMPLAERAVVYLPPSYGVDEQRRYPVVYYLTGFADQVILYTHVPYYQGFLLQEAMDRLIGDSTIGEMIVVIPNGLTPFGGSFYVNSPVNGNWEDFIVGDLVDRIDAGYRTIATPRARAIAGHSMGGFGALNIAMNHPDVFAAVYALSPGLAAPGGLETHPSFASPAVRERVGDFLDTAGTMENCRREVALLAQASYCNQIFDTYPLFALAYCAAFAPETTGSGPWFEYPFRRHGDDFARDPVVWERLEAGFGNWDDKIHRNRAGLQELSFIALDVGESDEHPWITAGCRYVSQLMSAAGISNELVTYAGGHEDRLRERLETAMLPALSRYFAAGN